MPKSLIECLPEIVAEGKKEVQRCLERIESSNKITLQTNECVLPAKDRSGFSYGLSVEKQSGDWKNRLIYGDNLLTMQALLCGDKDTGLPPMRGKIDLIYIDPPYDTDYIIISLEIILKEKLTSKDCIIILETDDEDRILEQIKNIDVKIIDKRKYGRASIIFLNCLD